MGGGPAGMTLGLLLARAGIHVTVLEKHADFLRDFRGDTIHPSTLELMNELGLLNDLLRMPHQRVNRIGLQIGSEAWPIADFSHVSASCKFIAFMPQWDFLEFLSDWAMSYPAFHLRMKTKATDLIIEDERIVGVRTETEQGPGEIRARLVIGADGRHSTIREKSQLKLEESSVPMDVLWLRISRKEGDDDQTLGRIIPRHFMFMINRGDYWQCAFLIPKGTFDSMKKEGLERFHKQLRALAPFLGERVREIDTWEKAKLLTVTIDRLKCWHRPGLLCIGDSAHAMSPIGGVGINLAIQDAVATANILTSALQRQAAIPEALLEQVQLRRMFPTRVTQRMQVFMQENIIRPVLDSDNPVHVPIYLRALKTLPWLQRYPARFVGMGVRPEHIQSL